MKTRGGVVQPLICCHPTKLRFTLRYFRNGLNFSFDSLYLQAIWANSFASTFWSLGTCSKAISSHLFTILHAWVKYFIKLELMHYYFLTTWLITSFESPWTITFLLFGSVIQLIACARYLLQLNLGPLTFPLTLSSLFIY